MNQNQNNPGSKKIFANFSQTSLHSKQELLGAVTVEILRSGHLFNRRSINAHLLTRIDSASSKEEKQQLEELIDLLSRR
ncbi:two-component-system connector protein YcgZ [Pantoea sp.]|uniref:two-component-system connector protein YcgZ n=1 Tax=Pantoea sp. TaxID=69393 RepID=UPI0028A601E0|nr:two-component-system connector protein YcgZ [Pantoea sp.]